MPLVRTQVHRLAGAWLARHGAVETAVSHAVAAAAWEEACRYVVDGLAVGQLLTEDPEGPLHVALAAIPQHVPGSDAPLVRSALSGRQAAGPLPEDLTEEEPSRSTLPDNWRRRCSHCGTEWPPGRPAKYSPSPRTASA